MTRTGQSTEYRVKAALEAEGYEVWKSPGSRSPADLLALKPLETLLVQVKSGRSPIGHEGWESLRLLAARTGGIPLVATVTHLAVFPARTRIDFARITGPHVKGSHHWPSEPFVLDRLEESMRAHPAEGGRQI